LNSIHHAARSTTELSRITARSSDRLTNILQRRYSPITLNARIGESGRGLLIRGLFQRRPARHLLQVLQRLLCLRCVAIETRQDRLPPLLIDSGLHATNNRSANRSTNRSTRN